MTYRMQTILPYASLLPEDVVTNNFHFDWGGGSAPISADYSDLVTAVAAFYETIYGSAANMAPYARPDLFNTKIYNLDDPSPRPPRHEQATSLVVTLAGTGSLPAETAVCASFQGAPTAGVPQARRRNRIYLGALGDLFVQAATSSLPPTVKTTVATGICTAMENLKDAIDLTANWTWVTYSPTAASTSIVVNGWCDNAIDSQRRRGVDTTSRQVWP